MPGRLSLGLGQPARQGVQWPRFLATQNISVDNPMQTSTAKTKAPSSVKWNESGGFQPSPPFECTADSLYDSLAASIAWAR